VSSLEDNDLDLTAMHFLLLLLCLAVRPVDLIFHSARVGVHRSPRMGKHNAKKIKADVNLGGGSILLA
jgi:hypothetical protein